MGKKWVMALSGIVLLGFVLGHMVGNLKLYLGAVHLNEYAEWLRTLGEPALPRTVLLWGVRLGLIAAFVLHIVAAAPADADEPAGPAGEVPGPARLRRRELRVTHDAVDAASSSPCS